MAGLSGKSLFITGASRGIGRAIAARLAADGAGDHRSVFGEIHVRPPR
jgi:NAD(P)-dependent dehydrogenase (short-subunit alcohol dehydrogenase family)